MAIQKNVFDGSKKKLKTTVGPVDRKKAVLEAEKGETVLTNLSENDNIFELKAIGGKKHSSGGTPLDLPTGDDNGKSASFIYSDNKKLLIKDKEELEFFGMESKKGMTPAEISKKHIDAVAKSKAIIKDMYADKIQKASAVKNLDNSRFALSALALWQESKKGMKDGFSEQFEPFFNKTKTTPEDIFKVDEAQQEAVGQQMQAAFGGFLEKKNDGGGKSKLSKLKDRLSANPFVYGYNQDQQDDQGNVVRTDQMAGAGVNVFDKSGLHAGYSTESLIDDFKNRTSNQSIGFTKKVGNLKGDVTLQNSSFPGAPINPSGQTSLSYETNNPTGLNANIGVKNTMLPQNLWNPEVKAGVTYNFAEGGQAGKYTIIGLPKADGGADTKKYKTYTKDQLPKDAVVKKTTDTSFKVGDFVEQPDGSYKKVGYLSSEVKANNTKTSAVNEISTWSQDATNAETLKIANKAIEDGLAAGTIVCDKKDKNGKCIGNNIKVLGTFDPDFRTKIAISKVINKSGKDFGTDKFKIVNQGATGAYSIANAQGRLDKTGSFVGGFKPEDYEKRYLLEKAKGQGLSEEEGYKLIEETWADPAKRLVNKKEFTSFLGVNAKDDAELMSDDFYKKNFAGVTRGIEDKLKTSGDYRPVHKDDAKSGFEHFDAFGFSMKPDYEIEADPAKTDSTVDVKTNPLNAKPPVPGKWDFRRQDIASLNRAIDAKNAIKKYDPWSKVGATQQSDTMFYSPERAIAAVNSQLGQGIAGVNSYATPGAAAAATSEMQGKAYEQVADQISNYADKNVGLFNSAEDRNTQLANIANAQDAANATSMHDKRQTLRQQFDNSMSAAKDKIVELSNAAWTNASNIFNLNQTTNNFKKDIASGIIYNSSGKPVSAKTSSKQDIPAMYAEYVKKMPGVSPDKIAAMVMGVAKGDYKLGDASDPNNQVETPEELIRLQQNSTTTV